MTPKLATEPSPTIFDLPPIEKNGARYFVLSDIVRTVFRGHREAAVRALGAHDTTIPNPHNETWRPARLYRVDRVSLYLVDRAATAA